jgi:hypothetical protein
MLVRFVQLLANASEGNFLAGSQDWISYELDYPVTL